MLNLNNLERKQLWRKKHTITISLDKNEYKTLQNSYNILQKMYAMAKETDYSGAVININFTDYNLLSLLRTTICDLLEYGSNED